MSYQGPQVFKKAVQAISVLPGIGEKTAQRLLFYLVKKDPQVSFELAAALIELKKQLKLCIQCFGYTEETTCEICLNLKRDAGLICVVEDPCDVFAIEKSGQYRGVYHVLHGALSPLQGVGPEDIKAKALLERFNLRPFHEIILATNPNVEGDTTALYLSSLFKNSNVTLSRIAMGIPLGGSLEYMDQMTLARAIQDRRSFGKINPS